MNSMRHVHEEKLTGCTVVIADWGIIGDDADRKPKNSSCKQTYEKDIKKNRVKQSAWLPLLIECIGRQR